MRYFGAKWVNYLAYRRFFDFLLYTRRCIYFIYSCWHCLWLQFAVEKYQG
jgi:hypothetical protein